MAAPPRQTSLFTRDSTRVPRNSRLTAPHPQPDLLVNIDGAARGNPGPAAIGVVIRNEKGQLLAEISKALGTRTNNQAEYEGLLAALRKLTELKPGSTTIRTDSELLCFQMIGKYRVRNPQLRELHRRAAELVSELHNVRFECIPREQNKDADRLANQALDRVRDHP